jgi:hypothetical protein
MKKTFLLLVVVLSLFSCIKKDALKYDPKLAGTWVGNEDKVFTWLVIGQNGDGHYVTKGDLEFDVAGAVRYSVFEKKMWIGKKKFRVSSWLTGITDGISELKTKDLSTYQDTTYAIDMKMVLHTTGLLTARSVLLYRVKQ